MTDRASRTGLHLSLDGNPPEEVASFEADTWTEWADCMASCFYVLLDEMGEQGDAVLARLRDPLRFGDHVPDATRRGAARSMPGPAVDGRGETPEPGQPGKNTGERSGLIGCEPAQLSGVAPMDKKASNPSAGGPGER